MLQLRVEPLLFLRSNGFILLTVTVVGLFYIYLVVAAYQEFGSNRIFGWDSVVYAYRTQETLNHGLSRLMELYGHPNAYILLLALVSLPGNDTSVFVNFLPVASIILLTIGSYFLTRNIAGEEVALLAAILTAFSAASLRLFVDLHRALLAFAVVTILMAMNSPSALRKPRIGLKGVAAIGLLSVVAFSELEIYAAYFTASLARVGLVERRYRNLLFVGAWSAVPGSLYALTPSGQGILSVYVALPAQGLIEQITLEQNLIFLSTVASVPFLLFGIASLVRVSRTRPSGHGALLLSWLIALTSILAILGLVLQKFPPFRVFLVFHSPILAALGAKYLISSLNRLLKKSSRKLPGGHFLKTEVPRTTRQIALVLAATALIVISAFGTVQTSSKFFQPVVPENLYARLEASSQFIQDRGWPEPIYLVTNRSQMNILPAIRNELTRLQGSTFLYFGDINFLPWLLPPRHTNLGLPDFDLRTQFVIQEHVLILDRLNPRPLEILQHPIVVVSPELFTRSLPDDFDQFEADEGLLVIPPNSLTLETFLTWTILPDEDSFGLGQAYPTERDWSLAPRVIEIYVEAGGYEISFPYYFPLEGKYSISLHLFDFPPTDFNSTTLLSPLELVVGDETVGTLVYGRQQVVWWNTTIEARAGFDIISLRASNNIAPFRLSLDTIVVAAEPP